MLTLPPERRQYAEELYAAAMAADPLHVYFFPAANRRDECLRALYRLLMVLSAGHIYASSPQAESCAVCLPPGADKPPRFNREVLSAVLKLVMTIPPGALRGMMRYDRFARGLHRELIPAPHWYLELIAVAPQHQGRGHAGRLLRALLSRADSDGLPCYLETHNPRNVPIYARFGFQVLRAAALPGTALTHFAMLRPAGGAGYASP